MNDFSEKKCCNVCDRKKVCHICGDQTLMACSDCRINFKAVVYVCKKVECRKAHDRRCCRSIRNSLEMIANLAHLAWTDPPSVQAAFERIEEIARNG